MKLCWKAQPGSFVAFFSLELSGPLGSKAQQNNEFSEIFRDPPDADHDGRFNYFVESLEPNTTYTFRLRAFNGFGAGPYTRGEFTTRPSAPACPVLVRSGTNTVTLRWKFGEKNSGHFSSMRRIVESCGSSTNGTVTRSEFMLAIDMHGKNVELVGFLKSALVVSGGGISVYDAIESSDDEYITIHELDSYEQEVSGIGMGF
mgnify:CR=1 FL=1